MTNRTFITLALGAGLILIGSRLFTGVAAPDVQDTGQLPKIDPDYVGLTVPVNIAPLNFRVLEEGDRFQALIEPDAEKAIEQYKDQRPFIQAEEQERRVPLFRKPVEKNAAQKHGTVLYGYDSGQKIRSMGPVCFFPQHHIGRSH